MESFEESVAEVERRAGGTLPSGYREWLRQYKPGPSDHRQTPYGLDELIKTQRILQKVIPPGHLAIGDDGYGNAVLLRFSDGSIEWWFHERKADDLLTDTIRPSFEEFLDLIAEGEV